ncbi:MAG: nuclear transport factor 2 family protein [Actinomycetota bacterium]
MARTLVNERLAAAISAHDIEAFVGSFHPDYRSEQPAHPDRAFGGQEQVRANWSAIFAGVPDVRGELIRGVATDGEEWGEWRIHGTRTDGSAMDMRGVIINGIRDDRIVWARLYLELVEPEGAGITAAVQQISGQGGASS